MKSLLISEVFPPMHGGSGRWMWELYRRMPAGSVVVAASEHPDQEAFDLTHELPICRMPLKMPSWGVASFGGARRYLSLVRRLGKLIRQHRPDRLDCGKCLPEGLLAWVCRRWHGIEYLCFVHGEELTLARSSRELAWLTRRVLHGASRLVANSRHTKGLIERDWGVPSERIVVLHPGVDTTKFVPAPRNSEVRARLGWGERPVILTVGALQKRKGQDMVIRALPAIREQVPNVLYAIVGEGWEREYLAGLVKEYGVEANVQFRGTPTDEELIACYQQCDLFVLANRQVGWDFEGFGIVLLEAQACGKPVITGMSGGTAETFDPGVTGICLRAETPEPIAAQIGAWLTSPERLSELGVSARAWATKTFDWQCLAEQSRHALWGPTGDAAKRSRMAISERPLPARVS